jgi:signal transduction histidine kinase
MARRSDDGSISSTVQFREGSMRCLALILLAITATACPSFAAELGTRDEAVAMVKRVQAVFAKEGAEATFQAVDDKANAAFHDRDLYAFVYDLNGVNVAHGARPALIGKNLISLKDQNGTYLIQEMIALAKGPGSGWVDYKWPNPITNKIEDKSSYVEKMGDYFVGVGVYRVAPGQL